MDHWAYIQQILVLLGTAMLLGALFEHFRHSAIIGYMLAGCLLGPGALAIVPDDSALRGVAEIGVALLLFTIGLEFSFKRLISMGPTAIGGGTLQIVITAILFGTIGTAAGLSPGQALAVGIVAAPSSTACVLRLLHDRAEIDSLYGRNSVGILLLQDLALVPMVVILSSMGGQAHSSGLGSQIAVAFLFFALLAGLFYLTSVYLVPRAMSAVSLLRNREILILLATVVALGAMWTAHRFSVSPALGAFIAGMLLAESPFATQIRADVGTPRVLLVTLFFASAGMAADLSWIAHHWLIVVLGLALVICLKALVIWGILNLFKQPTSYALSSGICLAQIGEFSFVLADIGSSTGVLSPDLRQLIISVTVGSLLLTPGLVAAAPRLARRLIAQQAVPADSERAQPDETPLRDHVVIVGFGPAGRSVAKSLREADVPFAVVELNHATVVEAQQEGIFARLGDAKHEHVFEDVHAASARAVVVTVPDHDSALHVVRIVHALAPEVPVIARSRYHRYAFDFMDAGATYVVDEEIQIGEFLGKSLVHGLSRMP